MDINNSFMIDGSDQGLTNQRMINSQLINKRNYYQEENLRRKIEFEKGMPLSISFGSNKVFTIPLHLKVI